MATKINQKEYLKKYLCDHSNDKKKKKKKQQKIKNQTVSIIDDDIDVSKLRNIEDKDDIELFVTGEDAPQVVGVVDDRPPELIALDFKNSNKWKVLSENDGWDNTIKVHRNQQDNSNFTPPRKEKRRDSSSDASPPRRNRRGSDSSPPQKSKISPARRRRESDSDHSPVRRKPRNSDNTPPRRSKRTPDPSPPRRNQRQKSPDASPPRKYRRGSDASPPRRRPASKSDQSPPRKTKTLKDSLPLRSKRTPDSDPSPPRRRKHSDSDASPPRKSDKSRSRRELSPFRKSPRRGRDLSPPRKSRFDSSPPRKQDRNRKSREKSFSPPPTHGRKMTKTLDGKTAGLQDAKYLRAENEQFKEKEKQMYDDMAGDQDNGRVVMRDRKTGRIRDLEKERQRDAEKQKEVDKRKAIYDRWGKGLKQTEDYRTRLEEHVHEMSKPLARYADDEDREEHLKKQERLGDPMLEYLRQKDRQKRKETGVAERPMYKGVFPDNRFNIRPGYRWDGVDRSNGFEIKWFEMLGKKEAVKEEIYKYSVEDM